MKTNVETTKFEIELSTFDINSLKQMKYDCINPANKDEIMWACFKIAENFNKMYDININPYKLDSDYLYYHMI